MLHDVQLSLSKLGDPVRSGVRKNRKNLTLATLVEGFKECGEQAVVAKLELHLKTFNTVSKDLRRRRNKWIAHFDLKTMLGSTAKPLEGPSRDEIDAVLDALRQFMNCVQSHYLDTETMYEHFVMNSDGEQLVSTLMQGLRYRELVEEQKIPFEDLIKTLQNGR